MKSTNVNWHFTSDGARRGLRTVAPANAFGNTWFWHYMHKRWERLVLGGTNL